MALIKCPECGKEFSSYAKECPNCACPTSVGEITEVVIPESKIEIHENEFANFRFLQSVKLNDGLQIIRKRAFSGCTGLKGIIIPESVREIESHAFEGCHSLAVCLLDGTKYYDDSFEKDAIIVVKKEKNKNFDAMFELAAINQKSRFQAFLGEYYEQGTVVDCDYPKALVWLKMAADGGDAEAANHIGNIYLDGKENVPRDERLAVRYYMLAAERGNENAQSNLGYCLLLGKGTHVDYSKALQWFSEASNYSAFAQCGVGLIYGLGKGVDVDFIKAFKYFDKAANSGHAGAMYNRAVCYLNGWGVPADLNRGIEEMKNAANRGSWAAKMFLEDDYTAKMARAIYSGLMGGDGTIAKFAI